MKNLIPDEVASPENNFTTESEIMHLYDDIGYGVLFHSPDGTIIKANKAACRLLGLPASQLLGKKITDPPWHFFHEDGSPLLKSEMPSHASPNAKVYSDQIIVGVYYSESKKVLWIKITVKPFSRPNPGSLSKVISILTDHSKEHQLEERRKELKAFTSLTQLAEQKGLSLDDLYQKNDRYAAGMLAIPIGNLWPHGHPWQRIPHRKLSRN